MASELDQPKVEYGGSSMPAQGGVAPAIGLPLLLFLVSGVQAFATFSVVALPTLATRASATFGMGAEAAGYQISIIYVVAACFSSIAGLIVRRHGPALTSLAAIGFSALGMVGIASGHIAIAILASASIGVSYGITNPAASHLLLRYAPAGRQNLIFALKQTGVPVGAMIAALLLPALADTHDWQFALLAGATLSVLVAVPLWLARARLDDDRDPGAKVSGKLSEGVRLVVCNPALRALAVMGLCYASFQFCLFTFLITMLVADFGWSLVAAGGAATVVQIAGAGGRIAWSLLADRIGRGVAILAGLGLASALIAALLGMASAPQSTAVLLTLLIAFGFCLVGWNGLWMAEIARASSRAEVSLATGGVLVFTYIGVMLGPAAFALAYGRIGSYAATFGWFACIPLIGAAALGMRLRVAGRSSGA